ncbi:MAG TPA: cytochrome d ubiquinol oxidase subunit II [Solibacterales bacterium]|nr:cytochrome d ubiquinol oxidase subunit II [Bryobacterales bacterium]
MEILWLCLVSALLAGYVVLDGFDLGAGVVSLLIARGDDEKRIILRSIGPVWDGNEVWLLAAGGTIFFAFPQLYASSFSGFYLPLMIVLWLLILRGIAIEFRNHLDSPTWTPLWDFVFAAASALLAFLFGAALGNVVRGVPLDASGDFFLPLWTNFQPGREPGILDWYTVLAGLFAFAALTLHGALWIHLKTEGGLQARARRLAGRSAVAVLILLAPLTGLTFVVQVRVLENFAQHPWGFLFPAFALAGLAVAFRGLRRGEEQNAFLGSAVFLAGMLASVVFGVFPCVLPSSGPPEFALTVYNAKAPDYGLTAALGWWIPGISLALAYTVFVYRKFAGKVRAGEGGH